MSSQDAGQNIEVDPNLVQPVKDTVKIKDITVRMSQIDPKAEGFLPLWLNIVSAQRAFEDPMAASPEYVERIYELLCKFMIEPADQKSKMAILSKLTMEQLGELFGSVTGGGAVPPVKGAA